VFGGTPILLSDTSIPRQARGSGQKDDHHCWPRSKNTENSPPTPRLRCGSRVGNWVHLCAGLAGEMVKILGISAKAYQAPAAVDMNPDRT